MNRLEAVRDWLRKEHLDGFILPRADEHLGEYVPPHAERLAWLTGFTGSAGLAVVLADQAAVFTDGRYTLQLAAETDPALWQRCHISETPPPEWIREHAPKDARIGYDPMLISEEGLARFTEAGLCMVPVANPIDALWVDRPPPPRAPAVPHPLKYAGKPSEEKRAELAAELRKAGQDAVVLTDPHAIAWVLNIRGADLPYTPVALAFAVLYADGSVDLFISPEKVPAETRAWLGEGVRIADRAALREALARLCGKRVRVDPATAPVQFAMWLREAGATVVAAPDPVLLAKACKNPTEQEGARAAHRRDGAALCRFLHWFGSAAPTGAESELSAAEKLLSFRREAGGFHSESFPAISAAGEHGAIIHYRVTAASNRPIRPNEVFLIDSGAQYPDGTTDVTRTLWTGPDAPPPQLCAEFTRVLKGHIAIASLVFPQGVAGPHLDAFARRALWQAGQDYDHGTGHGVGSFLSVHEGPAALSRLAKPIPLAAGMILSDEPGYYRPGHYGIRLENLLLVQPAEISDAAKPFLRFETLTLAPFDRRLVAAHLLTAEELLWLNSYHAQVFSVIGPVLDEEARAWLAAACAPIAAA
jgi:Xaa-Pro aminopeptidase